MAQITETLARDELKRIQEGDQPMLTRLEIEQLLRMWVDSEALRKDAERYDWLRHRAPFGPTRRPVVWMTISRGEGLPDTHETWLDDDELDAAIDAAMAEARAVGAA
jgi:hypothetical protein